MDFTKFLIAFSDKGIPSSLHLSAVFAIDNTSGYMPGGVDYEAAQKFDIKAIHALSLPGKVAPKTAGEIIKNTIYNMIEE